MQLEVLSIYLDLTKPGNTENKPLKPLFEEKLSSFRTLSSFFKKILFLLNISLLYTVIMFSEK